MRRLPTYLLVDTSDSMQGEPIEAVANGLGVLSSVLQKDPQAIESVWLSVITFGRKAEQKIPLTELTEFKVPVFATGGQRMLGAALNLVCDCWAHEVNHGASGQPGDFSPLVFILTDGVPDDLAAKDLERFRSIHWGCAVSCAAGPGADKRLLEKITPECVVELATADQASLSAFFKWTSISYPVRGLTERPSEALPKAEPVQIDENDAWYEERDRGDEFGFDFYVGNRVWNNSKYECPSCHEVYPFRLRYCPSCRKMCFENRC